jgi:hypothetical protein
VNECKPLVLGGGGGGGGAGVHEGSFGVGAASGLLGDSAPTAVLFW